ncbi:MAG: DUF1593 domain-containing protein [Prolixibacteraceae bacterium]
MKRIYFLVVILFLSFSAQAQKPRLIVLTDIGQDPDDEQSMVRLLHYANEFRIEGLIATADNNSAHEAAVIRDDIIHKMIDDYAKCVDNFRIHADDFPSPHYLYNVVKKGNNKGGTEVPVEDFIGEGFDTEGSEWIIEVVDRENPEPVCITVWGGAADLAQALWKVKNTRSKAEIAGFVEKLRVYYIAKQDASNQWIIENFPELWTILSLDESGNTWISSFRGMFWGGDMSNTTKEWIHENIHAHTELANNYPDKTYTGGESKNPHMALKEGDTPSFLYFLPNGLNVIEHPEWGGWGGRFKEIKPNLYRDAEDTVFDISEGKTISSSRATVFRWRDDFQNDFMARIDWAATPDYSAANHPPLAVVNGDIGTKPLHIFASPRKRIKLDAIISHDPDRDDLTIDWFQYREAGTYSGEVKIRTRRKAKARVKIPKDAAGSTIHIICKVSDDGTPSLCGYKRVIIEVL